MYINWLASRAYDFQNCCFAAILCWCDHLSLPGYRKRWRIYPWINLAFLGGVGKRSFAISLPACMKTSSFLWPPLFNKIHVSLQHTGCWNIEHAWRCIPRVDLFFNGHKSWRETQFANVCFCFSCCALSWFLRETCRNVRPAIPEDMRRLTSKRDLQVFCVYTPDTPPPSLLLLGKW